MKRNILLLALLGMSVAHAYPDKGECKIWNDFVDATRRKEQALLPDFSYAGYHHGESDFPRPQYKVFNVCDFGAVPNDRESDKEAILGAIKAAEQNGSGIVYFPKGRYVLNDDRGNTGPIFIRKGNIIFRGEGAGPDGSEIFMKHYNEAVNPTEKWTSPSLFSFNGCASSERLTEVTANAPKGSFSVKVGNSKGLKAGDWVCLRLSNNAPEVISRELHPYGAEHDWSSMLMYGVQVYDYHQIASVRKNTVTFKEPLMKEVLASEKWFIESYPTISEIGIEDLAFVGNWKEKFVHHKDFIHDGGWKFIEFKNVVHSWVTRCRFTDVSEAVVLTTSANVSVTDCSVTGNVGHNSMHAQASSRTFFGAINDIPAQWHSVGVAKHTMGTVIWRVKYSANSCFESHASQPRATLIDACHGGFMRGRAGGAIQNNPNHLSDLVLWNFHETDAPTQEFDFWATNTKYWRFMPPIIVGFHGNRTTFKKEQVLYEESTGQAVNPESLYEAQLEKRLGRLPAWVANLKKVVEKGDYSGLFAPGKAIQVNNTGELKQKLAWLQAGDTIVVGDGLYDDIDIAINVSGNFSQPIVLKAQNRGNVHFGNRVSIQITGDHVKLSGFDFAPAASSNDCTNPIQSLISISGNYCTISDCRFCQPDKAYRSILTTVKGQDNRFPAYCLIENSSFTDNHADTLLLFDQEEGNSAMGHTISKCYFRNTSGKGNAIVIGRKGHSSGKCLFVNNLFDNFHTEEYLAIVSSGENVFYNNSFMDCNRKLYFKSGNHQCLINNFFVDTNHSSNDGALAISNGSHVIGANYFALNESTSPILTLLNSPAGSVCTIVNNHFINNRNNVFDLQASVKLIKNKIFTEFSSKPVVKNNFIPQNSVSAGNTCGGFRDDTTTLAGFTEDKCASLRYDDSKIYIENSGNKVPVGFLRSILPYYNIQHCDIDLSNIIQYSPTGSPLNQSQTGCTW